MTSIRTGYDIASFYRFAPLGDPARLRDRLIAFCRERELLGTILLAEEGLNASMSGSRRNLEDLVALCDAMVGLDPALVRWTRSELKPFSRLRVRVKPEIVSFGQDLPERRGEYVDPEQWNELLRRGDVPVIDVRNRYETELGSFRGALDPDTESFRDFPAWVDAELDPSIQPEVAMYCTGGIRCEKASALLLARGFKRVYQLQGGILNYLQQTDGEQSLWQGECFLFDDRVAVDSKLEPTAREICAACRMPLQEGDRRSPLFEDQVSCPRCHSEQTEERRLGLRERARQFPPHP